MESENGEPASNAANPGLDLAARIAACSEAAVLRNALSEGPVEFRALGVSMRPLLIAGDRVRIEARRPSRGDVALAIVGGRLVLHRLVGSRRGRWLLRGDARTRTDGWVGADAVLGVATARRVRVDERARARWRPLGRPHQRWLGLAMSLVGVLLRRARGSRAARRDEPQRGEQRSTRAG